MHLFALQYSQVTLFCIPAGVIPSFVDLKMKIEETNNPDSEINKIVTVINSNPDVKIQVVNDAHMAVNGASTGSVILHLSPLTDTALHRFLSKDGRIVQSMVEKLLSTAGLHKLLKERKEFEVTVKINVEELSPEDKGEFVTHLNIKVSEIMKIVNQNMCIYDIVFQLIAHRSLMIS
jgi:hypothetical protein